MARHCRQSAVRGREAVKTLKITRILVNSKSSHVSWTVVIIIAAEKIWTVIFRGEAFYVT
eukprot:scaffold58163_cov39-Cyclotella_meneghiniana.AAC.4